MCTFQIVECPACDGDGRIYYGHANDPSPPSHRCDNCKGEGCVVTDIDFCTETDLDQLEAEGINDGLCE